LGAKAFHVAPQGRRTNGADVRKDRCYRTSPQGYGSLKGRSLIQGKRAPKSKDVMSYPLSERLPSAFRLFGVGVNVDPSWLIFALFVGSQVFTGGFPELRGFPPASYIAVAVLVVLGLSLSILLHELSHTLVGRAFGMRIDRITLYMFGGVAELGHEPRTPISEFLMALAGPALSVLLWLLLGAIDGPLIAARAPAELILAVRYLALINLILAAFNMIPAFPLDGGRVLRSLIWMVTRRPGLATRISAVMGQIFGGLWMLLGGWLLIRGDYASGVWQVILGLLIMRMAAASRRAAPAD
jgi:Zn-dependent protease